MTEYREWVPGVYILWDHDEGGYDWSAVALIARKKVDSFEYEYAVYEDGGCSCTYFYEDGPEFYNLDWTTNLDDLKIQIKRGVDSLYGQSDIDRFEHKIKALQALRKHRDAHAEGRADSSA